MKRLFFVSIAALTFWPASSFAGEVWSLYRDDQRGGPVLSGMLGESESDTDLWIACRKDGRLEVGAGANSEIGTGKGEKVSVTFSSANKTAKLTGVSRESANFQMTGGTELFTVLKRDDPLFAVLRTGKPLKLNGAEIGTEELPAKLAHFLALCPVKK
jgi:hypothetical protein